MPEPEKPKTWIIIRDGPIVKNHGVDGFAFAQVITAFQRALDNIGQAKYGKDYNKEDCRLYFKEILPGSAVIPLYPATFGTCLNGVVSPYEEITSTFEQLLSAFENDPDTFSSVLEKEIPDQIQRIGVLKGMRNLGSAGSQVEIKTGVSRPEKGAFVSRSKVDDLDALAFEYGGEGHMSLQGVIVVNDGDGKNVFKIRTKTDRLVSCYYEPKDEARIKSLYKCWVKVTGNMVRTQKTYNIKQLESVEKITTERFTAIGQYHLLKPVEFKISYDMDDSLLCLENDEIALNGYGSTYHNAIKSLERSVEGHALFFMDYPDEKYTDNGLEIKRKLLECVDLADVRSIMRKRDGDN